MPDDLLVLRDYLREQHPVAVGEIGWIFSSSTSIRRDRNISSSSNSSWRANSTCRCCCISGARRTPCSSICASIKVRGGIAHAFNGSRQQAEEFIKLGFKLGFGGAMTYSRATRLRELAATLPLDSIVLETDAPDIPPDFLERGEPNEPEYLPRIAADAGGIARHVAGRDCAGDDGECVECAAEIKTIRHSRVGGNPV